MSEELEIWGAIAPIKSEVIWAGTPHTAAFRIPTVNEELDIITTMKQVAKKVVQSLVGEDLAAESQDAHEIQAACEIVAEGVTRMAYAIISVDDKPIQVDYPTVEDRIDWILGWPGALFDACNSAYTIAKSEPFRRLEALLKDPNFATALSGSGEDSKGADSLHSSVDASPPTNGPSSNTTSSTTKRKNRRRGRNRYGKTKPLTSSSNTIQMQPLRPSKES